MGAGTERRSRWPAASRTEPSQIRVRCRRGRAWRTAGCLAAKPPGSACNTERSRYVSSRRSPYWYVPMATLRGRRLEGPPATQAGSRQLGCQRPITRKYGYLAVVTHLAEGGSPVAKPAFATGQRVERSRVGGRQSALPGQTANWNGAGSSGDGA